MTKMERNSKSAFLLRGAVILFLAIGLLLPAMANAQIKRCPVCKKSLSNCLFQGNHPKCSVCGKLLDKCNYKGKHPSKTTPVKPVKTEIKKERSLKEIIEEIENNLVFVESGTFVMGAPQDDEKSKSYEKPAHQVTVASFYISKCEITEEAYNTVMGIYPARRSPEGYPACSVSWDDCQAFLFKLDSLTGKSYRLPTEAEWEFAARGGNLSKGYIYSGSNNVEDVAITFNYTLNKQEGSALVGGTHRKTMLKQPNELGIYDMSGNVAEWCSDWYGVYPSTPQTNPQGPATGKYKITRGGSGTKTTEGGKVKDTYRVVSRNIFIPNGHSSSVGFRIVRN